jgi:pyruvate dehydrogenase E1 component alpha subunit
MSDPQKYRTKEELERKKNDDPILRLKAYLIDRKLSDNDALDEIDDGVKQTVVDAVKFAGESEFPDPEAIYENVYEESEYPFLA